MDNSIINEKIGANDISSNTIQSNLVALVRCELESVVVPGLRRVCRRLEQIVPDRLAVDNLAIS